MLVAAWGSRVLTALSVNLSLPMQLSLAVDWRVLAFALAVSLLVGVAFGLGPAWRVTPSDVVCSLKEPDAVVATRRPGTGRFRWTLRGAFVVAQVAASMALLVAGGLLAGGVRDAQRINLGFATSGRLAVLPADASQAGLDDARGGALLRDFADRVRGLPGVEAVTWTTRPPVTRGGSNPRHRRTSAAHGCRDGRGGLRRGGRHLLRDSGHPASVRSLLHPGRRRVAKAGRGRERGHGAAILGTRERGGRTGTATRALRIPGSRLSGSSATSR